MSIRSELRNLMRWLFRRRVPPPSPGTGQRYQASEQAGARRRLLEQAARLRDSTLHRELTQVLPTAPTWSRERIPYGPKGCP
ncbi:hypothetical protein AB0H57_13560 [Micromonospora sp. NPDC050686]|uniref:hypothetical protein n=1 Tax=Micromonospora sp. NPDC050686 TaxID=3154631 RepID=UPI0033DC6846